MQYEIFSERAEVEQDVTLAKGDDYYLTSLDKTILFPVKSKNTTIGLIIVGKVQFAYDLIAHTESGALGESKVYNFDILVILGKQAKILLDNSSFEVLPDDSQDEEFLVAKKSLRNLKKWYILQKIHLEPSKYDFVALAPKKQMGEKRSLYVAWEQVRILLKERKGIFIKYNNHLLVYIDWKGRIEVVKGHSYFSFGRFTPFHFHLGHDFFKWKKALNHFCCF